MKHFRLGRNRFCLALDWQTGRCRRHNVPGSAKPLANPRLRRIIDHRRKWGAGKGRCRCPKFIFPLRFIRTDGERRRLIKCADKRRSNVKGQYKGQDGDGESSRGNGPHSLDRNPRLGGRNDFLFLYYPPFRSY